MSSDLLSIYEEKPQRETACAYEGIQDFAVENLWNAVADV